MKRIGGILSAGRCLVPDRARPRRTRRPSGECAAQPGERGCGIATGAQSGAEMSEAAPEILAKSAAGGTGDLAKGTGPPRGGPVTLHPINAAGDVGKGGAPAGKNIGCWRESQGDFF